MITAGPGQLGDRDNLEQPLATPVVYLADRARSKGWSWLSRGVTLRAAKGSSSNAGTPTIAAPSASRFHAEGFSGSGLVPGGRVSPA